jgi:hypothetical protein
MPVARRGHAVASVNTQDEGSGGVAPLWVRLARRDAARLGARMQACLPHENGQFPHESAPRRPG